MLSFAFMTFSTPKQRLDEVLDTARGYGYAGVEPRVSPQQAHGIDVSLDAEQRQAVRRQFEASGVAMCCLAVSSRFADPAETEQAVRQAKEYIDLASDLGSLRLRVFGGAFPDDMTRHEAIDRVAEALASLAPRAEQRGVTLCMETHDAWTDPRHVAAVMEKVSHRHVAVNWDVMHPVRQSGWTMDEAYHALKPWIRHVHVHDGLNSRDKLEMVPIGQGDFDHRRVVELLVRDGYDGFVSGEWINWREPEDHLPGELETLKAYAREAA